MATPRKEGLEPRVGWSPERVETLKDLHRQSLSASQMANALGGVTRNAVIGKALRLGLGPIGGGKASAPKRANPLALSKPRAPRSFKESTVVPFRAPAVRVNGNRQTFAEPEPRPALTAPEPRAEGPGSATMQTLGGHMCKWPIGDPQDAEFTLCGDARAEGRPYCAHHARIAYQPPKAGQPRTGNDLARSLRRYLS